MYVCLCNGYRDAEISEVAEGGVRCARRAYHALGSGPRCGRCLTVAQALIDRIHEDRRGDQAPMEMPFAASLANSAT